MTDRKIPNVTEYLMPREVLREDRETWITAIDVASDEGEHFIETGEGEEDWVWGAKVIASYRERLNGEQGQ